MSLKRRLQEWKNQLKSSTDLDSVMNQDIYRFHYMNYHRIGEHYESTPNSIRVIDRPFKPFMLPNGMKKEDAFKVLSYLNDFIEKKEELEPCSYESVEALDKVIDIEQLGFKRLDSNDKLKSIDLFTITGRVFLFKKSEYYPAYFEWYTAGVSLEEVKDIYYKCGMKFDDFVFDDELTLVKKR